MNTIVDDTIAKLNVFFSRENYNKMLKFDTLRTSGLGHVAQLKSGDETLFFIGFPDRDMLEIFMMHLGVECREIGDCLFICGTTQDRDMIQQYWLLPIESESSTDDSGLPEL
jgi:hypothetical protein